MSFKPGEAPLPDLPRLGMQMRVIGALRNVEWYGRGPQENYWDRNLGAAVGIYKDKVDNLWFPYVEPQETGNRTDIRWVSFTDDQGFGLKATGMPLLSFSAWPFRMSELGAREKARQPRAQTFLRDRSIRRHHRQSGLPTDGRRWRRQLGSTCPQRILFACDPVRIQIPARASGSPLKNEQHR